ncbi:MAG: hypothetical protein IT518_13615 [Burkholderiales bacterium]|nr:hypothetical protein [Burkholderiales bacterium]
MHAHRQPCDSTRPLKWALLLLCAISWSSTAPGAEPEITIGAGSGSFVFVDGKGDPSKPITVFTYLPRGIAAADAPIAFVMHGHHRTAEKYRDDWARYADKYGFMVVAPLFDAAQWGHGQYSYASMVDGNGSRRDASLWAFSVVEHLFDAIKSATGNHSARYFLYGFSEGGQFVQRLVLFLPEARYQRAVISDPGWYTMPDFDVKFPYGLGGSAVTVASLKESLGRDVVLLLGDADTDPNSKDLRRTREAMTQGSNRYQRGMNFFREARNRAAQWGGTFGWRIETVSGVAHEPARMSGQAAAALIGQ